MDCITPSLLFLHYIPEFAETHVHWVSDASNHLILCHPLLLLPSVFHRIRVFSNESALYIRWPMYWILSFNISPPSEYSGWVYTRIGWLDLLAVQSVISVAQSCKTLCDPVDFSTPGFPSITNSWSLLKLISIKSVMPSSHLILCCPLLFLTSIFSSESVLSISWPNYWSFSFSISPLIEYSGLISFSIASFDFFAIQGTLKSLPQHHSSKALILFFMAQISHP